MELVLSALHTPKFNQMEKHVKNQSVPVITSLISVESADHVPSTTNQFFQIRKLALKIAALQITDSLQVEDALFALQEQAFQKV